MEKQKLKYLTEEKLNNLTAPVIEGMYDCEQEELYNLVNEEIDNRKTEKYDVNHPLSLFGKRQLEWMFNILDPIMNPKKHLLI